MAAVTDRQYRPVTTYETRPDDPLSVRAINAMADNLNNYVRYVTFGKAVSQLCIPVWQSYTTKPGSDSTGEAVVAVFTARRVPPYYNVFKWTSGHYLTDAGVGGYCTWKLYCHDRLYNGDAGDFDAKHLGSVYSSTTMNTLSTVHDIPGAGSGIEIIRGGDNLTYLTLTANNTDPGGVRAGLTSIDIWPATEALGAEPL